MACKSQIRKCPNLQWLSPVQHLPMAFSMHRYRNKIIFKVCEGSYFFSLSSAFL
jgi:hypothetical protein